MLRRYDLNNGTDAYNTTGVLRLHSLDFFTSECYFIPDNNPYAGTITPLKYYQQDRRVKPLMLKINHKFYIEQQAADVTTNSSSFA